MSGSAWELVFLMLIMKIPIVYLIAVVWYAIKAEPRPPEGAVRLVGAPDEAPHGWSPARSPRPRRPFRGGPHGSPRRGSGRPVRVAARRNAL